jgi:hypothetical protein
MKMTQAELTEVLWLHKLYLKRDANGLKANLQGADLRKADLRGEDLRYANLKGADLREAALQNANLQNADLEGADLRGADLDFSCWPLWCGSLGVKADEALIGQLLFHVADLARSSGVEINLSQIQKDLINKSSPVVKHAKQGV